MATCDHFTLFMTNELRLAALDEFTNEVKALFVALVAKKQSAVRETLALLYHWCCCTVYSFLHRDEGHLRNSTFR